MKEVDFVEYDYEYLCENLGRLSGLQIRIFKNDEQLYEYTPYPLQFDLMQLVRQQLYKCRKTIAFYEAFDILAFGKILVEKDNVLIVIGPTSRINLSAKQKNIILREIGESNVTIRDLTQYIDNMIHYPLENFLQIICFCNYALNDEKVSVSDLLEQQHYFPTLFTDSSELELNSGDEEAIHNTLEIEREMLSYIKYGRTDKLAEMFSKAPTGRAGKIAHDNLRQQKNLIICVATLASRAAIDGGLSFETAFSLSDKYIQRAELMTSVSSLTNLSTQMLMDYARRVEILKLQGVNTPFIVSVNKYVSENLDRNITTSDIAAKLNCSRSYLCERFRNETGMTINEFITSKKMDEAKRLLETSLLSASQISTILGFSSQSYFQNVFKKHVSLTPLQYRNQDAHSE
jgi:AraC-like DNA-binding protein